MYLERTTLLQMCCLVMGSMWRIQMVKQRGSLALLTHLWHVVCVIGLQWWQSMWALMIV